MNLYDARFKDAEWAILVVADTAKTAKAMFWRSNPYADGKYIDVRITRIEKDVPHAVGVYDDDSEEWTREYFCNREYQECHCRVCRERKDEEDYD